MRVWVAGIAVMLGACSSTPPCENDVEAFVISQTFVKQQLRAPSTASFPSITDPGVAVRPGTLEDGRCAFDVAIYTDAENAFGGTVRQNFVVTVSPASDGRSWDLINISPV